MPFQNQIEEVVSVSNVVSHKIDIDLKITSDSPLLADEVFESLSVFNDIHSKIIGTIFADQNGTLEVLQSWDGTNFDANSIFSYTASQQSGYIVDVVGKWFKIKFSNGPTPQTVFRLNFGTKTL